MYMVRLNVVSETIKLLFAKKNNYENIAILASNGEYIGNL